MHYESCINSNFHYCLIITLTHTQSALCTLLRVDDMPLVGRIGDGFARTSAGTLGATHTLVGNLQFYHLLTRPRPAHPLHMLLILLTEIAQS